MLSHVKVKTLLAVCVAATVFCTLAFVNNVAAIVQWWTAFLASGGDSSSVAAKMPGLFPWLAWSAVDYSAVTTLIPALGFLCMTVALARMTAGCRIRPGDFPFFRGSDQFNVALGLFGTLWGIIVIGYFRLDTVTMADLMQCLHTALFSTLMAVVWVFLIDRPLVRPCFARLLEKSGLAEADDGDLAGAVDRLVLRLGEASEAFDRRQAAYEAAFTKRQKEYEATFVRRLAEYEEALDRRHAAYERDFDARQREYVEFFRRRIDELERRAETAEARLKKVAEAVMG
jgi:hypothetical protein